MRNQRRRRGSTAAEIAVSVSAAVIALVALVVGVWQGLETRKHYRLSVKPSLEFGYSFAPIEGEIQEGGFSLNNVGVGPAVIEKMELTVDGKKVSGNVNQVGNEAIKQLGLADLKNTYWHWFRTGATLGQGAATLIFGLRQRGDIPDKEGERFRKAAKRLNIIVYYNSVYGEETQKTELNDMLK